MSNIPFILLVATLIGAAWIFYQVFRVSRAVILSVRAKSLSRVYALNAINKKLSHEELKNLDKQICGIKAESARILKGE